MDREGNGCRGEVGTGKNHGSDEVQRRVGRHVGGKKESIKIEKSVKIYCGEEIHL